MPRRKGGLFLPLDVHFTEDDKVIAAEEKAAWLYLCMSLASKRLGTDGLLTTRQIERLHVAAWKPRLDRCIDVGLVIEIEPDVYAIAAWFGHNDPVAVVADRRAADAERKRSGRKSINVRTESVWTSEPSPSVEKREEEKNEVERPAAPPDVDCEHGVDRFAGCLQCKKRRETA